MLVSPTSGRAPTSTKPFHMRISHPPVRSEPTQPSNEKGAPDVGLVSEAPWNVPHTSVLAEAALVAVVFRDRVWAPEMQPGARWVRV
jgi:hypothetical protein